MVVEAIRKLGRLDRRVALLAFLTVQGIKPVSKLDGFEGPDEVVVELLKELGLEVEVTREGCKTDILFGSREALNRYHASEKLKGGEKIKALGKLFGYPECCSRFFAGLMEGKAKGKPGKRPPLEHFICPGCKESPQLLEKYLKARRTLKEL